MLTLSSMLEYVGIPADKRDKTFFQWGNSPVGAEQPIQASLTILSDGEGHCRLSMDYYSPADKETAFLEAEVLVNADGSLALEEGEILDRQVRTFIEFVKTMPLIVMAEA